MKISTEEICEWLGLPPVLESRIELSGINSLALARPGELSFFDNPLFEPFLYETKASVVLVPEDFEPAQPVNALLLRVKSPREALSSLAPRFFPARPKREGIHPSAIIGKNVSIGKNVWIGPQCIIGDGTVIGDGCELIAQIYVGDHVRIGENGIFHPGVRIMDHCVIGHHVQVNPNAVIGGDGFGYEPGPQGLQKIPHYGHVILGNYVEIGAGTTIDRAVFGATVIEDGVKLDNLIQVAHNVHIGAHTVIAAQTGIAGSSIIGRFCRIAGQVGFADHIRVADQVVIGAQAGISGSERKTGAKLLGSPAIDADEFKKLYVLTRRLPQLSKKITNLESAVEQLNAHIADKK